MTGSRAGWLFALSLGALAGCSSSAPRVEPATSAVAPSSAVESVEPWSFEGTPGKVIRTAHYRVFTTETSPAIIDRLPAFLEDALDHYRSALTPLPPPPMRLDTYLLDSRPQWQRATLRLMGQAGEPFLRIGRGGFATRGVAMLYDIGTFDTLAIAAHEGWHQYTQRTFGDGLPMWLEEGVATYMEGHKWAGDRAVFLAWANVERYDRLRDAAARGELRSLRQLIDTSLDDNLARPTEGAITYYAQVWALVHFLNEGDGGKRRVALRELLSDASVGRLRDATRTRLGDRASGALSTRAGPAVFFAYFGDDLDEIGRAYDAFVRAIVAPGARDSIVAGRSPPGAGVSRSE